MTNLVFNAKEVLEMAKRIEANGGAFYRRAAEAHAGARELLVKIADQEDAHLATFTEMQRALDPGEAARTAYDPYDEGDLYLKAVADGRVFDTRTDPAVVFDPAASTRDVIGYALGIEKDSIVFYLGMKEMVPLRLGVEKIDAIIREEMRHIGWLDAYLREADGPGQLPLRHGSVARERKGMDAAAGGC